MVIAYQAGSLKKRRLAAQKRNADNSKTAELRAVRAAIIAGTYVPPSEEPETDETDETDETGGGEGGQEGQGGSETGENGSGGQESGSSSEGGDGGSETGEKSPLDQWSEDELRGFIEQNGGRYDRRWGKLRLVEEAKRFA